MSENQLVPVTDIVTMANAVAKSGLFGVKTPEQAMSLMLIAQAEGMHPAAAMRDYHVVEGKPTLKADAMLARFQKAGGKVAWSEYTDKRVAGIFVHPQGGEVEVSWTIDQAKTIGLLSKNNWKNYPRAMMRARVISEGVRTVYPGVVHGMYTPEEIEDETTQEARQPIQQPKEMGAAQILPATEDSTSTHDMSPVGDMEQAKILVGPQPLKLLRVSLKNKSLTEEQFCEHFKIGQLEDLTIDKINEAFSWIKNQN